MARRPFFLYVDEFHNLTTKSFAGLLSEARKYGLGLVLAHQHLSQTDPDVRDAILGNVGSMVVFRLGANDAPVFERLLSSFSTPDLQNQPNHIGISDELAARLQIHSRYHGDMTEDEHIQRHLELCQRVYERLLAEGKWPWLDSQNSEDLVESEGNTDDV